MIELFNEDYENEDVSFITECEESELLNNILEEKWTKLGTRRMQQYGYKIEKGVLIKIGDLPDFQKFILDRMYEEHIIDDYPDQLTIYEFRKGQKMVPFIDSLLFGPTILVLTINNSGEFVYQNRDDYIAPLIQRALMRIEYEARYNYKRSFKHGDDESIYLLTWRYANFFNDV